MFWVYKSNIIEEGIKRVVSINALQHTTRELLRRFFHSSREWHGEWQRDPNIEPLYGYRANVFDSLSNCYSPNTDDRFSLMKLKAKVNDEENIIACCTIVVHAVNRR